MCDHTRCGWKPREGPGECNCDPVRELDGYTYKSPYLHAVGCPLGQRPEEPPLTPEEEEQAPEDVSEEEMDERWAKALGDDDPPPPQPERRPPYLVAYSVSGHLFEVALPGDATVRAVDGALVIQHHLGPVAGIVSVLPVINKES